MKSNKKQSFSPLKGGLLGAALMVGSVVATRGCDDPKPPMQQVKNIASQTQENARTTITNHKAEPLSLDMALPVSENDAFLEQEDIQDDKDGNTEEEECLVQYTQECILMKNEFNQGKPSMQLEVIKEICFREELEFSMNKHDCTMRESAEVLTALNKRTEALEDLLAVLEGKKEKISPDFMTAFTPFEMKNECEFQEDKNQMTCEEAKAIELGVDLQNITEEAIAERIEELFDADMGGSVNNDSDFHKKFDNPVISLDKLAKYSKDLFTAEELQLIEEARTYLYRTGPEDIEVPGFPKIPTLELDEETEQNEQQTENEFRQNRDVKEKALIDLINRLINQ